MKKIWIWILIVLLVAAGVGAYLVYRKRFAVPAFESYSVKKDSIELVVTATGVVQAQNRLEIKPPIAGRIEEILVKEGQFAKKGSILAWMSSTERVALVDTAAARGPKERRKWEQMYRPTPILAPLTGLLILKNVEPGQTVAAADIVLVMSDHLIVRADVDETDIGRIRVGQNAKLTLDAYPKEKIQGKVDHIAFDAKTVNNVTVYQVDILPAQVPDFMRSGMTSTVAFDIEKHEDVLVVPQEAVHTADGESYVEVPNPDSSPRRVGVTTGLSDGKRVEVTAGLDAGDTVLVPRLSTEKKSKNASPFSPFGGGGGGGRRR